MMEENKREVLKKMYEKLCDVTCIEEDCTEEEFMEVAEKVLYDYALVAKAYIFE